MLASSENYATQSQSELANLLACQKSRQLPEVGPSHFLVNWKLFKINFATLQSVMSFAIGNGSVQLAVSFRGVRMGRGGLQNLHSFYVFCCD